MGRTLRWFSLDRQRSESTKCYYTHMCPWLNMDKMMSGAEAAVSWVDGSVVKERILKRYRLAEIDSDLRKMRTRREAKILRTLGSIGFPAPRLLSSDDVSKIVMEHVPGILLKDFLDAGNCVGLGSQIGRSLRSLHDAGIIHGDLTTSNMIMDGDTVFFIDFGLSLFSERIEDKAVDLHVLRQTLDSTHYMFSEIMFNAVISAYADAPVIRRLKTVEERGRNKGKN